MPTASDELKQLAAEVQNGTTVKITVRELLAHFRVSRRGFWITMDIHAALTQMGVVTVPNFEYCHLDDTVTFKRLKDVERVNYDTTNDPILRIEHLTTATKELVTVTPDQSVAFALTLMTDNDFSQLPVMTTKSEVKGVITWRSIAQAKAVASSPSLIRECMEQPHILQSDHSILDAVQEVLRHEFVLIRGRSKEIIGILTMNDLGIQFHQLAEPFILLGEIENHLRLLMSGQFNREQLRATQDVRKPEKDIETLADLTFGQYQRLLDNDDNWKRVAIGLDRKEVIKRLDDVREIRNDIMHFNPDPPESKDIEKVRRLALMLRTVRRFKDMKANTKTQ